MLQLRCFDAFGGTTDSVVQIATYNLAALETFVWNDKFSFFGGEPANQGKMTDAATQLAIGVQNSSVVQTLEHSVRLIQPQFMMFTLHSSIKIGHKGNI